MSERAPRHGMAKAETGRRLQFTLDDVDYGRLFEIAKRQAKPVGTVAREMLLNAMATPTIRLPAPGDD